MLPNLDHLTEALAAARRVLPGICDPHLSSDHAELTLILCGAQLGDAHFRTSLAAAAKRHSWDVDTIRRIIHAGSAVQDLITAAAATASPKFRLDPGTTARQIAATVTAPPATFPTFPVVPFTPQPHPTSVAAGLPIGETADGQPFRLNTPNVIVTAARGAGRTVLLHNVIAAVAQTVDAVAWVGDTDGGVLPPWMRNTQTRKLIDWPAFGEEATGGMLDAALNLVQWRTLHGAAAKRAMDTDRYVISPNDPLVVVVIDTSQEPSSDLSKKISTLKRSGPANGIMVVNSIPRATLDYLPAKERKLTHTVIAGRVVDPAEHAYVFQSTATPVPVGPGEFVARTLGRAFEPFRAAHITPAGIADLAAVLDGRGQARPVLPPTCTQYLPRFDERWNNTMLCDLIEEIDPGTH